MTFHASDERIVHPQILPDDAPKENLLRPRSLSTFVGQPSVIKNLVVFLTAAKTHKRALDHVLLSGPPGLGKTTLASIIAQELGADFRPTTGPSLTRPGDLASLMTTLKEGDILFIDEIHRLPIAVEELLYSAMEDFYLDLVVGEGAGARSIRLNLAPFTLIGATTRTGLLSNPLRDRFGIPLTFSFYSPQELSRVLTNAAQRLELTLLPDAAQEIASRSRGTPRIALRLLRRIVDFAVVEGKKEISCELANRALWALGIDQAGLDSLDRQYLNYILDHYKGGPVGVETLAAALFQDRDTIEDVIEPFLMQQGFVQRTPRGRQLSETAYRYLSFQSLTNAQEKPL